MNALTPVQLVCLAAVWLVCSGSTADGHEGARVVSFYGYDDCIELKNETVVATLCPAAGGRVLEYSLDGKNVLYLPAGDEGWVYSVDSQRGSMNAGRFDIGPEKMVRRGPLLWMGEWKGEITGPRTAKLTSQVDPVSGVQLIRTFALASDSSQLSCTQTIANVSDQPVSLCHWSRTFAIGGGIAIVPRTSLGRFNNGYVMYPNGNQISIKPVDENILVTEQEVVVKAAPQYPKLGFDSHSGWLAYLAPTDQVFVKRFRTYPDRAYNEVAGLTISVWYPREKGMVELEPIGPAELIAPGASASFTEDWWLLSRKFPTDRKVDCGEIRQQVSSETTLPKS